MVKCFCLNRFHRNQTKPEKYFTAMKYFLPFYLKNFLAPTLTKSPRVRVMATYKLRPSYSSYTHITVVADCDEASL